MVQPTRRCHKFCKNLLLLRSERFEPKEAKEKNKKKYEKYHHHQRRRHHWRIIVRKFSFSLRIE